MTAGVPSGPSKPGGPADPTDEHGTPLTEEEKRALIPTFIATREQLNLVEQRGILRARLAARRRRQRPPQLLTESSVFLLHRRMFEQVWRWAGEVRTSERNIGVDHWLIRQELRTLLQDALVWLDCGSYPVDEIAVRVHHRLTLIHCFANGNGRHARLFADLLAEAQQEPPFSWGAADLVVRGDVRRRYIEALKLADVGDMGPLMAFARS